MKSLFLFLMFSALASFVISDERIEDQWVVDEVNSDAVYLSVNGQVTYGDRLHIRLVKGNCDFGNLLTFVYSYSDNPLISELADQYVHARFMGEEVTGLILFTSPFLMGHRSTVDFNWAPLHALKQILGRENPITLEFIDSNDFKVSEYFDVLENAWSNIGLSEALEKAGGLCRALKMFIVVLGICKTHYA